MPKYVGTERCTDCHVAAGKVWEKTPHSHAYKTLVDAKRPSNRQYDPECIVCHTVGFGYQTGFRSEKETPKLLNVGCESCHGPGSLHASNPNDEALRAEMNPWKAPEDETPAQKTQANPAHRRLLPEVPRRGERRELDGRRLRAELAEDRPPDAARGKIGWGVQCFVKFRMMDRPTSPKASEGCDRNPRWRFGLVGSLCGSSPDR